ncbi:MAG: heavy metal-binding domain-containing protein [Elusimicrobiales bacterium]|nr:heavy metal-binding domain-containing protein [Elusimicrobiales bacterium]
MKKSILISIVALALGAGAAAANCGKCPGDKKAESAKAAEAKPAKKDCADCPMHKKHAAKGAVKKCGGVTCPEQIAGAETVSKKIENGVEVLTTAKDKETVAKIQELALVHYGPKADKCPGCPTTVNGAETKVENIENGIRVTITGKAPGIVKQIQEASAREHAGAHAKPEGKKQAKAGKKYTCAMKCVEASAPGKCPKCGMPMEEIK